MKKRGAMQKRKREKKVCREAKSPNQLLLFRGGKEYCTTVLLVTVISQFANVLYFMMRHSFGQQIRSFGQGHVTYTYKYPAHKVYLTIYKKYKVRHFKI